MADKTIVVENVKKTYGTVQAIKGISFSICEGQVVGLIGDNGAGKSTLMKMMTHIILPDTGNIFFGEVNLINDYDKALLKIGANLGGGMLITKRTGYENLCMRIDALQLQMIKKEILEEVCELFELSEFWHKKCEKCSAGMQQRIALAMAFAGKPQWIILDEPFNGLDPSSVKMAINAIRKVAKKGTAVIISSHLLYDIEKICDRALVLSKGTLLANKEVTEIVEKYNSIENFYFEIIEG